MPNDIANNMADTIHQLEEELEKAKRLLKAAVEGYSFIGHITKDYCSGGGKHDDE